MQKQTDILIIGGGLAGLSLAILCAKSGFSVRLLEQNAYPKQKVCGEYISMESHRFLESLGVPLRSLNLPYINRFVLTSQYNISANCELPTGGFGISRYFLDEKLAQIAQENGVFLHISMKATAVNYDKNQQIFSVQNNANDVFTARLVVGAFGRVANVKTADSEISNSQTSNSQISNSQISNSQILKKEPRTEFIGVKYHIEAGPSDDTIEIHNFEGGYCGISKVEGDKFCLCYLAKAAPLSAMKGDIAAFEREFLMKNPYLAERLNAAKQTKAVTTSQLRFGIKSHTNADFPYIGDAAGFIPPITGNGMSLAFRAASQLHQSIETYFSSHQNLDILLKNNQNYVQNYLNTRIKKGIFLQNLLFAATPLLNKTIMYAFSFSPKLLQKMAGQAVGEEILS